MISDNMEQLQGKQDLPPPQKHIGVGALFGTAGANLFIQGCTILQAVLLARVLGPVGRGEYAAIILWPSLFAGLGMLGMNTVLARCAAKVKNPVPVFRSGLLIALATSFVTIVICYFMLPLLLPSAERHLATPALYFLPFIVLNHLALALIAVDHGAGNFRVYNLTRILLNPIYLFLLLALWLGGISDVIFYVIALLIANACVVLVRLCVFLKSSPLIGPLYPLGEIIRSCWTYGLADLMNPLYQYADKALLLWLFGAYDLGIYTVALSAGGVVNSVAASMSTVTFTLSAQSDTGAGFERIAKLFRVSVWIWIGAGGMLAIMLPVLIPVVYGHEFSSAVWLSIFLIPAVALQGQGLILEQSLRGQGRAFVGLEGRAAGLVTMVLVGCFTSKACGIIGIVLALNAAQGVCLLIMASRVLSHYKCGRFTVLFPTVSDLRELLVRGFGYLKAFRSSRRSL